MIKNSTGIKHFDFTARDIELIRHCFQTMEQGVYERWHRFHTHSRFNGWLRTTPINLDLAPHLWGLFGAMHPVREYPCWDFQDAHEILKGRRGQVLETILDSRAKPASINLIVEQLIELRDVAYRSGIINVTNAFIAISSPRIDASAERWDYFYDAVDKLLPKNGNCVVTELNTEVAQPSSVCLWLAE